MCHVFALELLFIGHFLKVDYFTHEGTPSNILATTMAMHAYRTFFGLHWAKLYLRRDLFTVSPLSKFKKKTKKKNRKNILLHSKLKYVFSLVFQQQTLS